MEKLIFQTTHHFFPGISRQLKELTDSRDQTLITYPIENVIWSGIMLELCQLGSRRQLHYRLRTPAAVTHINTLAGTKNETVCHGDTLNRILEKLPPTELSNVRHFMIRELIRKRSLERFRLLGKFYVIAIDGTGLHSYATRHCDQCLTKEHASGKITYHHSVLEAKIVGENGFALSIETEDIENPKDQEPQTKQDCELKALYRMLPRLKENYPRLEICLSFDGIFPNQTVFDLCKKYGWKYIGVLKEGHMPQVYDEFKSLLPLQPENRLVQTLGDESIKQQMAWVTGISYHEYLLNILQCMETKRKTKNGEPVTTNFVYVTNIMITKNTCSEIANKGGRVRWKIENQGFKAQKKEGFELEHDFSEDLNAQKCFYLLTQIAHILFQLILYGNLLKDIKRQFGSIKNFTQSLLEAIRNKVLTTSILQVIMQQSIQICWNKV